MRELGFGARASSAGAHPDRRVARADELGLDCISHFLGEGARSVPTRSSNVKANAIRLGFDTSHLNQAEPCSGASRPRRRAEICQPRGGHQRSTRCRTRRRPLRGSRFAAAPSRSRPSPTVYDLLVDAPGGITKVQVKTTTFSTKDGWAVGVGHHPDTHAKKRGRRVAYDPDVIDLFFIIDGDLTHVPDPEQSDRRAGWGSRYGLTGSTSWGTRRGCLVRARTRCGRRRSCRSRRERITLAGVGLSGGAVGLLR